MFDKFLSSHRGAGVTMLCASACLLGLASAATAAPPRKGLTFGLYSHDPVLGVDHVGYDGTGNPAIGDTACNLKRPILCDAIDGSGRPNYAVDPGREFYQGWIEGHYATTLPVKGTALLSEAHADAICAAAFGAGWKMAEWHDGAYVSGMSATDIGDHIGSLNPWPQGPSPSKGHGGSSQWGFGNVRSDIRMWAAVNDSPGNCWNP